MIVRGTAATCGYAQLEQELELRAQSEGDAVHLLLAHSRAQGGALGEIEACEREPGSGARARRPPRARSTPTAAISQAFVASSPFPYQHFSHATENTPLGGKSMRSPSERQGLSPKTILAAAPPHGRPPAGAHGRLAVNVRGGARRCHRPCSRPSERRSHANRAARQRDRSRRCACASPRRRPAGPDWRQTGTETAHCSRDPPHLRGALVRQYMRRRPVCGASVCAHQWSRVRRAPTVAPVACSSSAR